MEAERMRRRSGQATVLVGMLVGFGVLMGFVALAVDGGSALVQRRNMQNGADGAALGAAKTLAASVVLSGGVAVFTAFNSDITARVDQLLAGNRGGTISQPTYSATLEYGTFTSPTNTYTYNTAAAYYGGSWHYMSPYTATIFVPANVDAVRVTAHEDTPTVFAALVGISSIPVQAVAASALQNAPDYRGEGPTWPMTRCAFPGPTPAPENGICNPMLFWSSNINDQYCNTEGNFKSLLQLGKLQGASYEGLHEQLLTAFDARPAMTEVTGVNNPCGFTSWSGRWSPGGNCSDPINNPPSPYGRVCCSSNDNVADMDIANFIVNEFQGTISLTSDWHTAHPTWFRPGYTPPLGDWLEVYNGGNLGNNIASYIRQYIDRNGTRDGLYNYYGLHVDKIMYLYDLEEIWKDDDPSCHPNCVGYEWYPTRTNEPPERVHMSQSFRFRFYQQMADTGTFYTPASVCGTSQSFNASSSRVYGVFAGSEVNEPPCPSPPCQVGHGINNYVGYIDP